MSAFALLIHSPDEGVFYEGQAESVTFPLWDGVYQILAGHQEEVAAVAEGQGKFVVGGKTQVFCTTGGVMHCTPTKVELALLHVADPAHYPDLLEHISETNAKERRKQSSYEHHQSAIALAKAINQGAKGKRPDED